jgi:acyl transferase domain-containing protein
VKATSKIDPHSQTIAIVGMGCRFPGAQSLDSFWKLLRNGEEAIRNIGPERLQRHASPFTPEAAAERGGFLDNIAVFDARFFGISRREAVRMDPQQRILLEVAWEALQDAGQLIGQLAGTQTGVFIGVSSQDYSSIQSNSVHRDFVSLDSSPWVVANRLSHLFGLRGPSMAIDTAGSSSLVAIHLACQSLRNKECSIALAGGVNVILSSITTAGLAAKGLLAPDGCCKSFDARANGYVRGEGAGVVVLKTLSQAKADGDRIYALIRGSANNHDGSTNGLLAPSRESQESLLRAAYRNAGIAPREVQYAEAQSAGTLLGDLIEAKALGAVFSVERAAEQPCLIGSVKTNIGHLEAAAGVASLIKVALSLHHDELPPSLHFQDPNPQIAFDKLKLQVAQALTPWLRSSSSRIAGISSFGLGGTNAHVVLEEPPAQEQLAGDSETSWYILPLSAKNSEARVLHAENYRSFLQTNATVSLRDVCYTAGARRDHFAHRLAIVGRSSTEMVQQLGGFVEDPTRSRQTEGNDPPAELSSMRSRYESGDTVEWSNVFPGARHISLPVNPWQRETFWFAVENKKSFAPAVEIAPNGRLLGRRIHSPLKEVLFETNLTTLSFPFLAEHRPFGVAIAPVAVYLLMALDASEEVFPNTTHSLAEISVNRALILEEGKDQKAQLILTTASSGEVTFHLYSQSDYEGKEPRWTLNGSGRLRARAITSDSRPQPAISLGEVRAQCALELPGAELYERFSEQGLSFGDAFQWVERIWAGEGMAVGRMRERRAGENDVDLKTHPGLLDSFQHVLAACHPSTWDNDQPDSDRLFVPVSIAEFNFYGHTEEQLWCHAALQSDQPAGEDEYLGDASLLTASGELVAEIKGVKFRLVQRDAFLRAKPALLRNAWSAQARRKQRVISDPEVTSAQILAADQARRLPLIERYVREQVARITKFPAANLDVYQPLINIGVDSLMSMEIITRLQADLGVTIPVAKLVEGVSIDQLTSELMRLFTEKSLLEAVRSPGHIAENTEAYEVL